MSSHKQRTNQWLTQGITQMLDANFSVNSSYGVEMQDQGPVLPWIQATDYNPKMTSKIDLCFPADSLDRITESERELLKLKKTTADFGGNVTEVYPIPDNYRFVVLGLPGFARLHRETEKLSKPVRGQELGEGFSTATRLCLTVLKSDGQFIKDNEGKPQVFFLKLTGLKTALVNGDKSDHKSLVDLNKALQKHLKLTGVSLLHLASIGLGAIPYNFVGRKSGKSKVGARFVLVGNAKQLTEDQQKMMYELVQDEQVQAFIRDPFGLDREQSLEEEFEPVSGADVPVPPSISNPLPLPKQVRQIVEEAKAVGIDVRELCKSNGLPIVPARYTERSQVEALQRLIEGAAELSEAQKIEDFIGEPLPF